MTQPETPDRRLRPVHLFAGIVLAIAVGIALVTGIGRLAGFADLRRAVRGADPVWLAVCVAGQMAVFTGYTGAMRRVLADGGRAWMPARLVARLVLASFAATQVFAFGGVGGLAIVYWALRRVGFERDEAAVRMIGLNTAVYLVFGVVGWSAAVWGLVSASAPAGMTVPWLVGIPLVLVAARWFTAPDRISRWTTPATTMWQRALGTGIAAAAWVRAALGTRERRPLFAWAALYWAGDVASLWAALRAFGADPPVSAMVIAYTTGYLVQSLPIPLIGTGGVDAATTFLLHAVGVPLDVALLGVVTHRVFAFWLPVIPGSVFALSLPAIGRELTDAAGAGRQPSVLPGS